MRRFVLWASVGVMAVGLVGSAVWVRTPRPPGPLPLPDKLVVTCLALIMGSAAGYAVVATMHGRDRLRRWEWQTGRVVGWASLAAALAIVLFA